MGAIRRASARAALAVLACAAPLAACATKVASSSPGPFSTLDGNLSVDTLDAVQSGQLCMDVQLYAATALTDDQVRDYRCAVATRVAAQGVANESCAEIFRFCELAPPPRAAIEYGRCSSVSALAPFCRMKVSQLGQCLDAVAKALADAAAARDADCFDRDPNPLATAAASAICHGCTQIAFAAGSLMSGEAQNGAP